MVAQQRDPAKAAWFRKLKATARPDTDHGVTYIDSPRHKLEVQHYRYRTYIKKLLKKFGPMSQARWQGDDAQARREPAAVEQTLQAAE